MVTWKQVVALVAKALLFGCLLYACVGRDWYNYQGHCKGANGTHNAITKGLWEACIKPEYGREYCYPVRHCNDVDGDDWYTSYNITRPFDDADNILNIFFTNMARAFMLLSLICAGIALTGSIVLCSDSVDDDKKKKWWQNGGRFCSVATPIFCWCWWCFVWLLLNSDGRNSYESVRVRWDGPEGQRMYQQRTIVPFGQDFWTGYGTSFYFGLISMALSNGIGLATIIVMCRQCRRWCRSRGRSEETSGGRGYEEDEDTIPYHTMNSVDTGQTNNSDSEALLMNM